MQEAEQERLCSMAVSEQSKEEGKMFKADMIAPCGLDCNICSQALIENDPCQGCNGPDDHKPEFCEGTV